MKSEKVWQNVRTQTSELKAVNGGNLGRLVSSGSSWPPYVLVSRRLLSTRYQEGTSHHRVLWPALGQKGGSESPSCLCCSSNFFRFKYSICQGTVFCSSMFSTHHRPLILLSQLTEDIWWPHLVMWGWLIALESELEGTGSSLSYIRQVLILSRPPFPSLKGEVSNCYPASDSNKNQI